MIPPMAVDLSIVVVHWNVPELLAACLTSIDSECKRTDLVVETFVVDNASPDSAFRCVVDAVRGAELIELEENRGYAAGCNAGITRARGDAILLLNPDTELRPGALDVLWQALHISAHIGLVAPLLLNPDGSVQSAGYSFPGVANVLFDLMPLHPRLYESPLNGRMPVSDGVQPMKIDYPLGAAMLLRRAALDDVGPLDESYGMYSEEVDWARRLANGGWTALLAPSARVVHRGGQSTGQRPEAMYEALWTSRAMYYRRYATVWQRRVIRGLVSVGTRWEDRRASPQRRATNARIRSRFADLGSRT